VIVVVKEDDIQVRGIAEFLAAQLAVGDDGEGGWLAVFARQPAQTSCRVA
jgi:hypothetical protein